MQKKLPLHDWLVVAVICGFALTLTAISISSSDRRLPKTTKSPHYPKQTILVEVVIQGAVQYPGIYHFPKGTSIEEALEKAKPLPEALLNKIKGKKKLLEGQKITVPAQPFITVYIEGAVLNSGPIRMPKGSRLQDLKEFTEFTATADETVLNKKRKLKDQEKIQIPDKQKGQNKAKRSQKEGTRSSKTGEITGVQEGKIEFLKKKSDF